jgi:HD-GYP domain-containing protein (c-di-GMP phosphodiesterase class II)
LEIECQHLKKALASLERSYHITLEVLGEALGLKTHEIEGPSKRVTVFTICIARAMGLSREHINPIAHGAVFHDVGKMAIPDRILRKPVP